MSVKERAMAGEWVCGTMIRAVRTPAVVAMAKRAGLDFVMFDCEHGSFNMETLHDAFLAANALGIEAWARVPVATKDYVSRVLDQGASGIMAPLTETPEYARQLVTYSKYPPIGDRGFANGANTMYQGGGHAEIMEEANRRVMSIVQIETRQGVDRIEEIISQPGVDAAIIGPNDLSISLGVAGQLLHPIEQEAIRTVAAACKKHHKLFTVHCTPDVFDHYRDVVSFVMQMGDTDALSAGFRAVKDYCDRM